MYSAILSVKNHNANANAMYSQVSCVKFLAEEGQILCLKPKHFIFIIPINFSTKKKISHDVRVRCLTL